MSAPLYLALGDDLSLDGEAGPGTGAASRFFRDDGRYAGFEDRDLGHRVPGLVFRNLATEGATSAEVALEQVAALDEVAGELRIVTLTVGRADFLQIWGAESQTGEIAARDLAFSLEEILATARRAAGDDGLLLVTNLPDPTDGTGEWGAFVDAPWEEGLVVLDLFNRTIEAAADEHDALRVDLHAGFHGHGLAAADPDHPLHDLGDPIPWFVDGWTPSDRGAHEIRRLLWEAVEPELG
jgi:hypothetical protein